MDPTFQFWLRFLLVSMNQQRVLASQTNTMPPIQYTYSTPGPVHQHTGQQHQQPEQYRPNSRPIRHQHHRGYRTTEASRPYQVKPKSSRTIPRDRSNGTHPRMGAIDNSGPGEARPPSRNPRMRNRRSKKPRQIQPFYNDDRSGPSQAHIQEESRGEEDLSTYEIPLIDFTMGRTEGGLNDPTVIAAPVPAESAASTSAVPVSMPASSEMPVDEDTTTPGPVSTPGTAELRRRGRGGNIKTKTQKRPVYDDDSDVHRVSSGSDTD